MKYRLWVNDDRTILVRLWDNGIMEVALRPFVENEWSGAPTWGPPINMTEETTE